MKYSFIFIVGLFCFASCTQESDIPTPDTGVTLEQKTYDGGDVIEHDPIIQGPVSGGSGSSQTSIADADVKIKDPSNGNIIASTKTDSIGNYAKQVPPGIYDVEVSAPGYTTSLDEDVVVDDDLTHPVNLQ